LLEQYIVHILSDTLLLICASVMLSLFLYDLAGLATRRFGITVIRHYDFKSAIVSIGIFGTFLGILIGLYNFDSENITESVPFLLEGLKFAFVTSVIGMFFSIILSVLQKMSGEADEGVDVFRSMDSRLGELSKDIKRLAVTAESPTELVRQFSELKDFLQLELQRINQSLEKALEQLGSGATSQVIEALEKVIVDFNQNLQEQFGENFKELNQACLKLLEWQRNYRDHVDTAEDHLKKIRTSLQDSTDAAAAIVSSSKATNETCDKVASLIQTYDIQVATLATYLEKCKQLGSEAKLFLTQTQEALTLSSQNMNSFSEVIEKSVSKQSETLAKLTQDIEEQLPRSLEELEEVLTKVTNQFTRDYHSLFEFMTAKR